MLAVTRGEGDPRWNRRLMRSCPISRSSVPGADSISSGTVWRPHCRSRSAIVSASAVIPTWRGSSRRSALVFPSLACVPRDRARRSGRAKQTCASTIERAASSRGPDGMPPLPVFTVSRVEVQRSRQLMCDSRMRIASAKALVAHSRQSLARQSYIQIVCAWCQQLMRWQRVQGVAWGQSSHSICYDCFAQVLWEPELSNTPPPISIQATAGGPSSPGLPLREEARRAGGTDTMADLARYRGLLAPPANAPLTPRTCNEVIPLP